MNKEEMEGKNKNGQVLIFITFDSQAIFFVRCSIECDSAEKRALVGNKSRINCVCV